MSQTTIASHANCKHPKTKSARDKCRRENNPPEMTPEERRERASRAGKAHWEGKDDDYKLAHRIVSLRSEAEKLGFRLVPIPEIDAS